MSNSSPCIFYDGEEHIWRFIVKSNGELMYSIMYEEDKWTKASKIDDEVIDFTVDIDYDEKIYIIYSVKGGELKYCTLKDGKWFGKALYSLESTAYLIREINVTTLGKNMHIFFIARNKNEKSQGTLIHLCLNGEKSSYNVIYNISLMTETYSHYQIEILKGERLRLFLISSDENGASLKIAEYKNDKWSPPKRLYGINGSKANFSTILYRTKINILNFSKENSIYSLEHVSIEHDGQMTSNKIYESADEIYDYLILEKDGMLFAMWTEDGEIFYSLYSGRWSEPFKYEMELNEPFLIYKFLSVNSKYENIKAKNILGTMPPEVKLLLPEVKNEAYRTFTEENSENVTNEPLESDMQQNSTTSADELTLLRRTVRGLEKKILNLQIQLQQKQRIIEESDGNFLKLNSEKKKSDERLKIIMEIQQASAKELENMRNQLSGSSNTINELASKLHTSEKELELVKKQLLESNNITNELKNNMQELIIENEQLKTDLEYEQNKGFVDRILRKKS